MTCSNASDEIPCASSTDPAKISRFLDEALHELVSAQFGKDHLPAVDVQIVQARQRLEAFAHWQAQRAADGWEIVHTESSGGKDATRLPLGNGTSVILRGRIDRIDHKEGTWAILDYKTGDKAKSPQETHLKAGKWIDLQLPLYVQLARSLDIKGPLQLGYILLPKEIDKVGDNMATWDEAMLEEADQEGKASRRRYCSRQILAPLASRFGHRDRLRGDLPGTRVSAATGG